VVRAPYSSSASLTGQPLQRPEIQVIHDDAVELIANNDERIAGVNTFYVDPARRGAGNSRLFAISDCEPDLTKIISLLQSRCKAIIVKLSPMLDITQVLKQIPDVREVHIVSIKNDCKELLVISKPFAPVIPSKMGISCNPHKNLPLAPPSLDRRPDWREKTDPVIYCVNYTTDGTEQSFCFRLPDEQAADSTFAKYTGRYLYEPNASVLKAGAYKSVAIHYNIKKLHVSSHLYTSDLLVTLFPGRIFEIAEIIPFSSRIFKTLNKTIPHAHIAVRNFPLSVEELRKRTRIKDGGEVYLFATTLSDNQKALIKCRKI
jgi:hypothetical protein